MGIPGHRCGSLPIAQAEALRRASGPPTAAQTDLVLRYLLAAARKALAQGYFEEAHAFKAVFEKLAPPGWTEPLLDQPDLAQMSDEQLRARSASYVNQMGSGQAALDYLYRLHGVSGPYGR